MAASGSPGSSMTWPPGTAAPAVASSSSRWSVSPAPPASAPGDGGRDAGDQEAGEHAGHRDGRQRNRAKLSTMPITATVPSAAAVIGAVARVAPTDEPRVRQQDARPGSGRSSG